MGEWTHNTVDLVFNYSRISVLLDFLQSLELANFRFP